MRKRFVAYDVGAGMTDDGGVHWSGDESQEMDLHEQKCHD
jgi:hypothetical protein